MSSKTFKISVANTSKVKHMSDGSFSYEQLDQAFNVLRPRDSKDGDCFVAGKLFDGLRNLKSVDEIHMLVYDLDGQQSLGEVQDILAGLDIAAWLYTTHSHRTTKTQISTTHYEKWAKQAKQPLTPTTETLQAYLKAKGKGHLKNVVWNDIDGGWERLPDIGNVYIVEHDPVDKMRVVFPLDTPIVIHKLGSTNKKCNDAFKAIYHGVGQHFKLIFDPACADPSRLFFFPSCKPGQEAAAVQLSYDGPYLDWAKIPRATVTSKKAMDTVDTGDGIDKPTKTEEFLVKDRDGKKVDLWHWYRKHYFEFDIEGLLEEKLSDQILLPRENGGYTITCPFEDEHSTIGGMGTFAANSDGEKPWTIYCSHASCQGENRKRPDFMKAWIEQQMLTLEDFLSAQQIEELHQATLWAEREDAFEALGVSHDILQGTEEQPIEQTDSPLDADIEEYIKRDPEKFQEEIAFRIRNTSTVGQLNRVMAEIIDYNRKIEDPAQRYSLSEDLFVEWLASTTATISLKDAHSSIRKHFSLPELNGTPRSPFVGDPDQLIERISTRRSENEPYDDAIFKLVEQRWAHDRLAKMQKRIAGWYDVLPSKVKADYNIQNEALVIQVTDQKCRAHYPDLRAQYGKLVHSSKVEIIDEKRTPETGKLKTLSIDHFHNLHGNTVVTVETKKNEVRRVQVTKEWLKDDTMIRVYNDVTFDPGKPFPRTPQGEYNLWCGFPVKPIKLTDEQRKQVEERIVGHIKEVWCEGREDLTQWVLMFFADLMQRPWNKPQCAICVMGGQGTGKSIILDLGFKPILKHMYTATSERDQLVGKFNKHAEGKLLWLAEESLFGGAHDAMNKLKDLISRDTIMIEPKTKDTYEVPNRVRYVFTSNQIHPLKLEHDDRRFLVLGTSDKYKQNTEYHSELKEWFAKNDGARLWMSYLMEWKFCEANKEYFPKWKGDAHSDKCTGWQHLFLPPLTKYKVAQQKQGREASEDFFIELLTHGRLQSLPPNIAMEHKPFSWPYEAHGKVIGQDAAIWTSKGEYWLNTNKTEMRNLFNSYVRYHAPQRAQFTRNDFLSLWDRYFGEAGKDDFAPRLSPSPSGSGKHGLVFPPRSQTIYHALKRKLIAEDEADLAAANVDSHLGNVEANRDNQ